MNGEIDMSGLDRLSSAVIGAAISVHSELGPGLFESVYQACMLRELSLLGLPFESEVPIAITYRGEQVDAVAFRIDILVSGVLVVELKSVEVVKPVHKKQVLTYLRLTHKPLGLLINFNEPLLKRGITRVINTPT